MESTQNVAPESVFSYTVLKQQPGYIRAEIKGKGSEVFKGEQGGHRFQRIPPTEKKGRVHTSTVTVSVRLPQDEVTIAISPSCVKEQRYSGTGKGGQHRNKHANCVRLIHRSGVKVQVEGRHYHKNKEEAYRKLEDALRAQAEAVGNAQDSAVRKAQMGTGMRGDKRRTCIVHRDKVVDHKDGWEVTWKRYMRGDW